MSATIPPSPRLSACMTRPRSFTEMTMTKDQKIRERMPGTFGLLQVRIGKGPLEEFRQKFVQSLPPLPPPRALRALRGGERVSVSPSTVSRRGRRRDGESLRRQFWAASWYAAADTVPSGSRTVAAPPARSSTPRNRALENSSLWPSCRDTQAQTELRLVACLAFFANNSPGLDMVVSLPTLSCWPVGNGGLRISARIGAGGGQQHTVPVVGSFLEQLFVARVSSAADPDEKGAWAGEPNRVSGSLFTTISPSERSSTPEAIAGRGPFSECSPSRSARNPGTNATISSRP